MRFYSAAASSIACGCFLIGHAIAQTFQRLGTCPDLGCVFPPDQADFLPGQYFDIRLEVHAPLNGSEANKVPYESPDENFTFTVQKEGGSAVPVTEFFSLDEVDVERWNFTYYETLYAQSEDSPTVIDVAAKAYRKVALYEPGNYIATLNYYGDRQTVANWTVREGSSERKAKNTIMFIGVSSSGQVVRHLADISRMVWHRVSSQQPVLWPTRSSMASIRQLWRWTSSPSLACR